MTKLAAFGTVLRTGDDGQSCTFTNGTDIVNCTSHGFSDTNRVMFGGDNLPTASGGNITEGTVYFVRDAAASTFKIARTSGGAAINLTSDGTPPATVYKLATVAQVRGLSGPELTADTIDVTTHDSTSAVREFVSGFIDTGEVSVDLVWDPDDATHQAMRTDLTSRSQTWYQIEFPSATVHYVSLKGAVTKYGINAPADGSLDATIGIKAVKATSYT